MIDINTQNIGENYYKSSLYFLWGTYGRGEGKTKSNEKILGYNIYNGNGGSRFKW